MKNQRKILLVVSNYNEEGAILDTIENIKSSSSIKADILIIDNSSTDKSIDLIKKTGIDYLLHSTNTGSSGGVIKTAFAYAHYHDYDIYCHMDGDNQHKSSELDKLIKPLIANEADVVTGSRFIEKQGFQSSFLRRMGITLFSKLISMVTKRKFTDITSGFRAYNKKAITYFARNFKQEIETITQMELIMFFAGLRTKDVPVTMQARTTGKSGINAYQAIKFPIYNFISFFGTIVQKYK